MNLEKEVIKAVRNRARATLSKSEYSDDFEFEVVVVCACYILGNEKYLLTTNLPDGRYYEVTYNRDKNEMYLDEYLRVHNEVI